LVNTEPTRLSPALGASEVDPVVRRRMLKPARSQRRAQRGQDRRARGATNREIARCLYLSSKTVEMHPRAAARE
jgi:DNA-binding NarL/FixJ family response regulator